uniref:Uncharacterized protein n=1 Tax=Arundo donax TaxID=35708 RepID=A0A0A9D0N1_ARUDO
MAPMRFTVKGQSFIDASFAAPMYFVVSLKRTTKMLGVVDLRNWPMDWSWKFAEIL